MEFQERYQVSLQNASIVVEEFKHFDRTFFILVLPRNICIVLQSEMKGCRTDMPSRHREEVEVFIHNVGARSGVGCQRRTPAALLLVPIVWEADVDEYVKSRPHRCYNPPFGSQRAAMLPTISRLPRDKITRIRYRSSCVFGV
jgi:hypothetical protein